MTHSILPTDIELAKNLLKASRPDSAIIAALVHRGIETATAAQLVSDLRNGRPVSPQIPAGLEIGFKHRSGSKKHRHESEPQAAPLDAETAPRPQREPERHHGERKSPSTLWMLAAVPICFVVVIVGVLISNYLRRREQEPPPNPPQQAAPARELAPAPSTPQKAPPAGAPAQSALGKTSPGVTQLPQAAGSNAPASPAH
jgi:hypothetical protein